MESTDLDHPPCLESPAERKKGIRAAKTIVCVGGSLAMIHQQVTQSPATTQFALSLGASGFHLGLLGALPIGLLFAQLVCGLVAHRLPNRKSVWFWVTLVHRCAFLPIALGPWLFPSVSDGTWIWTLIGSMAVNQALGHFASPLWLSWISDYLPRKNMSRFWGLRQQWMHWSASGALILCAVLLVQSGLELRPACTVLMLASTVAGVVDVLLFLRVPEPPMRRPASPPLSEVLLGPLRCRGFRSYIVFGCTWHMAVMFGAPFMHPFLLEHVGVDLYHLLLLWGVSWSGGALLATKLGVLTDRHGNRPVLVLSTLFKGVNMVVLLLLPFDPMLAFWVMMPVLMFDTMLNAGFNIATNGYLLRNSPAEHRTMFIAAGMAFAGLAGGMASILGGVFLKWTQVSGAPPADAFRALFALSLVLRIGSACMAVRIHEPGSHSIRRTIAALQHEMNERVRRWTTLGDHPRPAHATTMVPRVRS